MMMAKFPEFISCNDLGAAESEIEKIEDLLGHSLTKDYVETLKQCNAPYIESLDKVVHCRWLNLDQSPAEGDEAEEFETISPIFSLWNVDTIITELKQVHEYSDKSKTFLPKWFVPIAHNGGGGDYIMDVSSGPDRGSIYLWYVNLNDPWGDGNNRFVGHIADNFTQFIQEKIVDAPEDW
jgi:hypothetical protein